MTTALTILGGLALLVIGQIIIRSFIDPIYELRKLRGEIADALIYHANTYLTPDFLNPDGGFTTDARKEARDAFRSLGSQLEAKSYAVPFYRTFAFIRAVPYLYAVKLATDNLRGLSISVLGGKVENIERSERHRNAIIWALNLRIPNENMKSRE